MTTPLSAAGVVCELNPPHAGHARLFAEIKKRYPVLVCALSGAFVQRGTPAVINKWTRAQIAVAAGADLVLEIPQAYVLQSADYFARGGVATLAALPAVHAIGFGVEEKAHEDLASSGDAIAPSGASSGSIRIASGASSGDEIAIATSPFENAARSSHTPRTSLLRAEIKKGRSLRSAWSAALARPIYANQILGWGYRRALRALHLDWDVVEVSRASGAPSATRLRQSLARPDALRDPAIAAQLLEPSMLAENLRSENMDRLLDYLRIQMALESADFTQSPQWEPGMEHRIAWALRQSRTLDEALQLAANKRHSRARYRRLLLTTLLGIQKEDMRPIRYLRPLAFNEQGAALLKDAALPIIQKKPSAPLDPIARRMDAIDRAAQALADALQGDVRGVSRVRYYIPQSTDAR